MDDFQYPHATVSPTCRTMGSFQETLEHSNLALVNLRSEETNFGLITRADDDEYNVDCDVKTSMTRPSN